MSLLMDALRRAEAEKKQQAAREQREEPAPPAAAPPAAGSEDVTQRVERAALDEAEARADATGPVADDETSLELDIPDDTEPGDRSTTGSLADTLALEPMDDAALDPQVGDDDTRTGTHSEGPPGALDTITGTGEGVEQTATMPSSRAVQKDLEAYFDRSQSMEVPRRRLDGDHTLEDVAAHTMVGAQTVFAAAERPRSRRIVVVAAALGILVVLAIGALGIYFVQQTPGTRPLPSPTVARGVEREPARELPVVPLAPPGEQGDGGFARLDAGLATPAANAEPAAPGAGPAWERATPGAAVSATGPETVVAGSVAPETTAPGATAPGTTAPATVPSDTVAPETAASDTVTPAPDPVPEPAYLPDAPPAVADAPPAPPAPVEPPPPAYAAPERGVGAGEVRIARSVRPAAVDGDAQSAYAAWRAGDVATARARYAALLADHPDRRDALLGLGGIALQAGDLATAYRHYANVLRRFPDDPVASAALVALTGGDGPDSVARIRLLLDRHGDSAFLHFVLGNVFARQQRWPDAQQAYFDAVRLDADNADYTYNLAVALDRMGHHRVALDHYRRSLTLADGGPAAFNPSSVLARIAALTGAGEP